MDLNTLHPNARAVLARHIHPLPPTTTPTPTPPSRWHEISPQIAQCEYIIHYTFRNKDLADEALRTLIVIDETVDRVRFNIPLAILGRKVMEAAVAKIWWWSEPGGHSKERWDKIHADLLSTKALAERGRRLGMVRAMQLVLREGENEDKLLATAIEAIVGAVFVDSGDTKVDHVCSTLGLYGLGTVE